MHDNVITKDTMALSSFIEKFDPSRPSMPLTHAAGTYHFSRIATDQAIRCTKCSVFEKDMSYFFYGRPAYRPLGNVLFTSNPSFRPVCILLEPIEIGKANAAYPFDTGAFCGGLFAAHCPSDIPLDYFRISADANNIERFIRAFFETNRDYYLGKVRDDIFPGPLELAAQIYLSIQRNNGQTEFDDRRSTVEVQSTTEVKLSSENVMAVSLPEIFLDDASLRLLITETWKADVIPYDIYHDRPSHDVREMMSHIKRYLNERGIL